MSPFTPPDAPPPGPTLPEILEQRREAARRRGARRVLEQERVHPADRPRSRLLDPTYSRRDDD